MVQNRDGLPLMYQIHKGNIAETKTFSGAISTLVEQYPINRIIVVADRGLVSEENLKSVPDLGKIGGKPFSLSLRFHSENILKPE